MFAFINVLEDNPALPEDLFITILDLRGKGLDLGVALFNSVIPKTKDSTLVLVVFDYLFSYLRLRISIPKDLLPG